MVLQRTQNDNILKLFLNYVLRNVMSMIGLSCYIMADTLFIANGIGSTGLTALNLVLPVYSLLNGVGLMIGMGGATRYSILYGEGHKKQANTIFTNSIYLGIIMGVLFTAAGVLFTKNIVVLLGADRMVAPLAYSYLLTILSFSFAFLINNILVCFIRNDNNPGLSMAAMLGGSFSNIILDYVFIYIFKWGMFGAAFATGLAPVISMIILSAHIIKKKNNFRLVKTGCLIRQMQSIITLGVPSFITEFSSGIIMLLINFSILKISGNIGVAAYGIVANLALIAVAVFTGIAQGIQPIISASFGSGNEKTVKVILRYAIITASACGILFILAGFIFTGNIIALFNKENNMELAKLAKQGIILYFTGFLVMGFNIVATSYYASIEKALPSFVISILRGCAAVIPSVFILSKFFQMNGIWMAIPVAEFLTFAVSIYIMRSSIGKVTIRREKSTKRAFKHLDTEH